MSSFFGAMTTAISGIRAQASALGLISDNIANSSTIGFKRTTASFSEIVTASNNRIHVPGAVLARPSFTNSVQGAINSSDVSTHMAINGEGFFIVAERIATLDNQPVFLDVDRYTRRGDFTLDRNGYMVNGGGYYLKGLAIDPLTNNPIGDTPDLIQINRNFLPARATTTIDYEANLPAYPETVIADPTVANSELLLGGAPGGGADPFANDPSTITGGAGNGFVQAGDEQLFLDRSLAGGSITVYDSLGAPANVQLRWAKVDNAANGAGTGAGDTWNLFYKTSDTAVGAAAKWVNVGTDYIFNSSGVLTPAISSTVATGMTVNGVSLGNVTLDHGASNITQFIDNNGTVAVNAIDQDGYAAGELVSIAVTENGRVAGTYSNGKTIDLAEISLAKFPGVNQLKKLDGTAFAATQESGEAILGRAGDVIAQATEASNVDIADEFSKLIVTQQAYSANTRIVTTADDLIRETLNMKR